MSLLSQNMINILANLWYKAGMLHIKLGKW